MRLGKQLIKHLSVKRRSYQPYKKVLSGGADSVIATLDIRLQELQKELLNRANSKMDYEDIADEIYALREEKQGILEKAAARECDKQRIEEMQKFLNEQIFEIEEYDEILVRKLIKRLQFAKKNIL